LYTHQLAPLLASSDSSFYPHPPRSTNPPGRHALGRDDEGRKRVGRRRSRGREHCPPQPQPPYCRLPPLWRPSTQRGRGAPGLQRQAPQDGGGGSERHVGWLPGVDFRRGKPTPDPFPLYWTGLGCPPAACGAWDPVEWDTYAASEVVRLFERLLCGAMPGLGRAGSDSPGATDPRLHVIPLTSVGVDGVRAWSRTALLQGSRQHGQK
jgi:hypothetical protein